MKELYDKDMREVLFSYFEETTNHIRFLEEVTMGKSRADAIMVSENEMVGFELKSDKDSLIRLKRQVPDYDRFFDRNYLVTGEHFVTKAHEVLPPHWGIIKIWENEEGTLCINEERQALNNPAKTLRRQLDFLWRKELIYIMKEYKLGGVSAKSKKVLREVMFEKLDEETLKKSAMWQLMEREYPVIYSYRYETPAGNINFVTDGVNISYITFLDIPDKYIRKDDLPLHERIKEQFDEYFSGQRKSFDLPLENKRFNSFSRKVYAALCMIPYGETTSYAQIAAMAGRPAAYRAVGLINNRNPYPILVPCHRVVGANGKLTGYAGGLKMKEFLLNLEKNNKDN